MDVKGAFFLGFIQGLTEFLPISSSGHLILVSYFFKLHSFLAFDAFLHLGSFFAIFAYFYKELTEIFELKYLIVLSVIPGALAGVFLEKYVETIFRTPLHVAFMLFIMSFPMILGEKFGKKIYKINSLSYFNALIIGLFQALAVIPGTSRSGITISAGLFCGLKREEAARYSFLAGAPLILGASLYEGIKIVHFHELPWDVLAVGFFSSFLFSFIFIKFLLSYLKKHSLYVFVGYRWLLALIIFILWFLKFKRIF